MKRLRHIIIGLAALSAWSAVAMPIGLRSALWNRSARSAAGGTYTIRFDLNGGGTRADETVAYGAWKSVAKPTRAGYEFAGWVASGHNTSLAMYSPKSGVVVDMRDEFAAVPVTGNVSFKNLNTGVDGDSCTTLTAQWKGGVYELGYDNQFLVAEWIKNAKSGRCITAGGTLTTNIASGTVTLKNGTNVTVWTGYSMSTTPSKNAGYYAFPVEPGTKCRLAVSLSGKITGKVALTVFCFDRDGAYIEHKSKNATAAGRVYLDFTTLPDADHAELRFGVYNSGDNVTFSNIKFIKFSPYANISEPYGRTYTYETGAKYGELAVPTRAGYTFGGWFTEENGGGTQITEDTLMQEASLTVYSKWTQDDIVVDADGGRTVTVPRLWILGHPAIVSAAGGNAEEAVRNGTAANGRKIWECYVLGLDPENGDATNDFRIVSFPMKADGMPDLGKLVFEPPTAKWNVPGARAVIEGAAALGGEWQEVPVGGNPAFRFFRVKVALP